MHWHTILAASIGIIMTIGFIILLVAAARSGRNELNTERRDLDNITAIFNSLPAPENPIPTTLRKVTK